MDCCTAGALEAGEAEAALLRMSTLSEEGVMAVKQTACDRLLSSRVEMKMKVHG
jgi:nucleolar GTP-binding protein